MPDMNILQTFLARLGFSQTSKSDLSDDMLLKIFRHLDIPNLVKAGQVCCQWRRIAWDDSLWKKFAQAIWPVKDHLPENKCWRDEFERLARRVPTKQSAVMSLTGMGTITRICVTPDGQHFAVLSIDGWLTTWNFATPCTLNSMIKLEPADVGITMFMSLNEDGSLLFVSGTNMEAARQQNGNECVGLVFNMPRLRLVTAVRCYPQLMYGAWLDIDSFVVSARGTAADTMDIRMFKIPADKSGKPLSHYYDAGITLPYDGISRCLLTVKSTSPLEQSNVQTGQVSQSDGTVKSYLLFCNAMHRKVSIYDITQQKCTSKPSMTDDDMHACFEKERVFITGLNMSVDRRFVIIGHRQLINENTSKFTPDLGVSIFDLQTMTTLKETYLANISNSGRPMCHIWPQASNNYISSGSEEPKSVVWDRHHEFLLSVLRHGTEVVNKSVICPHDEETIITASDDTIHIWRSKNRMKSLGLNSCRHRMYRLRSDLE